MLLFRRKKLHSMLGLDIDSTSVKILELSRCQGQYCVEAYGHMPLSLHWADTEGIAAQIKTLLFNMNFTTRQVVLAIPDTSITSQVIQLNACVHARDIEEWVYMAVEQYIPYPINEINLDFNILGPSSKNANLLDILVVASRSRNVALRVDAARRAGLRVQIVDVESYAIKRAEHWLASPFNHMAFATTAIRERVQKDAALLMVASGLALRGLQAASH